MSYDYRHVYDTYDVTDLMDSGDNAIGILVGAKAGYGGGACNIWGDTIGPLALLVVTDANGSTTYVPTDATWQARSGPILAFEIYDGEKFDSSLDIGNYSSPGYDSSDWLGTHELPLPKVKLVPPDGPPVRRMEELSLRSVFRSDSGQQVLDFGQNMVGWLRLTVDGPAGTTSPWCTQKPWRTAKSAHGLSATRPPPTRSSCPATGPSPGSRSVGGLAPAAVEGEGRQGKAGWGVVKVAPVSPGGIQWAEARYLGAYGLVVCKWWVETSAEEEKGGQGQGQQVMMRPQRKPGLYLQVTIPPNSRAEVTVPGGGNETVSVGSGFHEWFVEGFEVPE